jgi:hypothetical protein
MMKKLSLALVGILLAVHLIATENPLTNQDVVKLVKLGIGDDAVIAKVRQAPAVDFKLETDDLGNLKTAGVSGKVIAAMLDRVSGAATGEVVTPEAAHALAASRSGPGSGAWAGTLEAKDGKKTLTMHMGQFHQTGFAGFGNTFWVYSGARCALRTSDRRPTLTIRRDTAPQQQIFLAKLDSDSRGNERSLKVGSLLKGGNPFSDKTEAKPDPDWVVDYDATENPSGVWHLTPKADLPPGEYGIYLSTSVLLDFGVDG